jgi:hypothetical protein
MNITSYSHTVSVHDATSPTSDREAKLSGTGDPTSSLRTSTNVPPLSLNGTSHVEPRDRDALALALGASSSSRALGRTARGSDVEDGEIDSLATPSSENECADQDSADELEFDTLSLTEPEIPYLDHETVLTGGMKRDLSSPAQP